MARTIQFTYEGKDYTLEFNRRSIEKMEQNGFDIESAVSKPMSTIPMLFEGAFLMHHPYAKKEVINEIFNLFTNKKELFEALTDMYSEPLEALLEDNTSKNAIAWGKNF
jgi:hypothetical protein